MKWWAYLRGTNLLMIGLVQFAVWYGWLRTVFAKHGIAPVMHAADALLLSIATVFIASFGYLLNDWYDVDVDQINGRRTLFTDRPHLRHKGKSIAVVPLLLGTAIVLYLTILCKMQILLLLYLGVAVALWGYAWRLQRLPFIGNAVISLLTAGFPLVYYLIEQRSLDALYSCCSAEWHFTLDTMLAFAGFAFLITLAREIIKDMQDIRGDYAYGYHTLPLVVGWDLSIYTVIFIAAVLIGAVLYWAFWVHKMVGYLSLITVVLPLVGFIWKAWRAEEPEDMRSLSRMLKVIMLAGMLLWAFTIAYFYYFLQW